MKNWFDVYLQCYKAQNGYITHPKVSNWFYKCTRYLSDEEFHKLEALFYPKGVSGIDHYEERHSNGVVTENDPEIAALTRMMHRNKNK